MQAKNSRPRRRSLRLKAYDYSQAGAYFVTACVKDRQCLFGEVIGGTMSLNEIGKIVNHAWNELPNYYPTVKKDQFVVMPNHIHAIIFLHSPPHVGAPFMAPNNDQGAIMNDKTSEAGLHSPRPYVG